VSRWADEHGSKGAGEQPKSRMKPKVEAKPSPLAFPHQNRDEKKDNNPDKYDITFLHTTRW